MATALININGQVVEASSVELPSTGRTLRDAWTLNGDVIEVDMTKAVDIHIDVLVNNAKGRADAAEKKSDRKTLKGEDTSAEDAEVAKFKSKPKKKGIDAIVAATTPDELAAITEDDLYGD